MKLIKIGVIHHDWTEQMDVDELNKVLTAMGEPANLFLLATQCDEFGYLVHSLNFDPKTELSGKEQRKIWEVTNYTNWREKSLSEVDGIAYNEGIVSLSVEHFKEMLST